MPIKTLLVCDDRSIVGNIQGLIAEERSLMLLGVSASSQAYIGIQNLLPELVWIHLHSPPILGLSLLAQLRQSCPRALFLVSSQNADPEVMRTAYRLGACDVLDSSSWKGELVSAIERIDSRRSMQGASSPHTYPGTAPFDKAQPLNTLLVCDAGEKKRQVIEGLINGRKELLLLATVSTAGAGEKVQSLSPALIWLELSPDPDHALLVLADLKERFPQTRTFVSYDRAEAKLIRASYRLGASEFLDAGSWKTDLAAALGSMQPGQKRAPFPVLPFLIIALLVVVALLCWSFHG